MLAGFSREMFDAVMATAVPLLAVVGALSLANELLSALLRYKFVLEKSVYVYIVGTVALYRQPMLLRIEIQK